MPDYAYLSLDNLKAAIAVPSSAGTSYDAALRRVLEAVSEQIDVWCERTFRTFLATRYYQARRRDRLDLDADLLAVTTLKTLSDNTDGTRTYGDTWATTDYDLWPDNAATERRPYTRLCANPSGAYWFPGDPRGVQIVGRWGFWQDTETLTATLAEALDSSETGVDVSDGTAFDALETILIDSEQMYITAISSNTLTVRRGVNGTTAAAHDSGAAIARYRYPAPIVEACGIQAARIFNRAKASPMGVAGSSDMGVVVRPVRLDSDIRGLIEGYRAGLA